MEYVAMNHPYYPDHVAPIIAISSCVVNRL